MKKIILFLATLLVLAFPEAFAYDFSAVAPSGQRLYYNIVDGGVAVTNPLGVSPYWSDDTKPIGALTIPDSVTYDGIVYAIVSVGEKAFYMCSGLSLVTIPGTVTTIDKYAFYYCEGLVGVVIQGDVTAIGNYAFYSCQELTEVTIQGNVTAIGTYAFYNCKKLTNFTIPTTVTTIGNSAFNNCYSLVSVTIPDNVISIGNNAFFNVRHIVYHGTASGGSWGALSMNGFIDGDFIFSDESRDTLIQYVGTLANITIPQTVSVIGTNAFNNNNSIVSVTIPNGLLVIGSRAFYSCNNLTAVSLPNTLTTIGEYAFQNCKRLVSINIPSGVTTIGNYAFSYCTGFTSLTIPNGISSIGNFAFSEVKNIVYHGMAYGRPWGALSMNGFIDGDFIFASENRDTIIQYIGVQSVVTIPSSVTVLAEKAFYNNDSISLITIPEGVISIGSRAFYSCNNLTEIIIPEGVTTIEPLTFYGCTNLTSVILPPSVTSIETGAFQSCSALTNLVLHEGLTGIGAEAFRYCSGLTTLTLPNGLLAIGEMAFYNCTGLNPLLVPPSVVNISSASFNNVPRIIYYGDFTYGAPWGALAMNGNDTVVDGDFLYADSTKKYLIGYLGNDSSITIPSSVTAICKCAFYGNSSLVSVTIPASVTLIGTNAFSCYNLRSVYISTMVPPAVGYSPIPTSVNVYLPCGTKADYQASWGSNYRFVELTDEELPFAANISPNNDSRGTVTISPEITCDTIVTISATPAEGFFFAGWSDGVRENSRQLKVTQDTNLFAIFDSLPQFDPMQAIPSVDIDGNHISMTVNYRKYIPDGNTCDGYPVNMPMVVGELSGFDTIASADEIKSVCVDIEHSWMGDLTISVVCPNGNEAFLKYGNNLGSNSGFTIDDEIRNVIQITGYGGGTCLGLPLRQEWDNNANKCDSLYQAFGVGAEYCFSRSQGYTLVTGDDAVEVWDENTPLPSSSQGYYITSSGNFIDSVVAVYQTVPHYFSTYYDETPASATIWSKRHSNREAKSDFYLPVTTFEELVGCPIQGQWNMRIYDTHNGDNGWAFGWSMELENTSVAGDDSSSLTDSLFIFADAAHTMLKKYIGTLDSVVIPSTVVTIMDSAFFNSNVKFVAISENATSIGKYAFSDCDSLTSIVIPDSVVTIGWGAFSQCGGLESVTIGSGVTTIGMYAFYVTPKLTSIIIPDNVATIGNQAFTGLKSIMIGTGVSDMSLAFNTCGNLESITVAE